MKINTAITISDIHLEWDLKLQDFNKVVPEKFADAIFLNGDIAGSHHALPFIKHLLELGYSVFYVLGNHEFYDHTIEEVVDFWRSVKLENFYFLHQNVIEFDNVRIIGAPLWASVNTLNLHPIHGTIQKNKIDYFIRQKLKNWGDFENIKKFNIDEMARHFWSDFEFIQNSIAQETDKKTIVMTHFPPSFLSVDERYAGRTSNYVFANELDFFIENSSVDFWLHGHSHTTFDYFINKCRIICNPRGYYSLNMLNPHFEWLKLICV